MASSQTKLPTTTRMKAWVQVVLASTLMLATLPGRSQGLGLITEPLLADLKLDRVTYASINLWATFLGAGACFPAGYGIDRFGLTRVASGICLCLGLVVWQLSRFNGTIGVLFLLLLATRALGQSALSVTSITTVGRWFPKEVGLAMGVYSILLSVLFAIAFLAVGHEVRQMGWRAAWGQVALCLVFLVFPLVLSLLKEPTAAPGSQDVEQPPSAGESSGLVAALQTRAFWLFAGAGGLFNLASAGIGLFNEAILAERNFDQSTFHLFLAVSTLLSLVGQMFCGWMTTRWSYPSLTSAALILYGVGLVGFSYAHTPSLLWLCSVPFGIAGGMIIVVFFSVWSDIFGQEQLGRIQGAAQLVTVVSSGLGPVVFAQSAELFHSYTPVLIGLAASVLALAAVAPAVNLHELRGYGSKN